MKKSLYKVIALTIVCVLTAATLFGCTAKPGPEPVTSQPTSDLITEPADAQEAEQPATAVPAQTGNFTDEMKIPYTFDLSPEDGADSVERSGDHADSPYFNRYDFYNAESTDTLTILPKFKTQQQTSEWSCGVSSAIMVLEYYGKLGDYNEETLSAFRTPGGSSPGATSLRQMVEMFDGVGGFDVFSTFDVEGEVYETFSLDYIHETLKEGTPILIGWNDWGGHWQVIVGYDTMGTDIENDDVLIVADPYDTTDHNQDGYGVYGAERFIYNFTFYNFFPEEELNDMTFLTVKPE
jgi:hypothetical protein